MNRLPSELHEKIFSLLSSKRIYECALVCRQWSYTAQSCLYNSIYINCRPTFDKFMDTLIVNPSLGNLVHHLETNTLLKIGFDVRLVCRLFPNLKTMILPSHYTLELLKEEEESVNTALESILKLDDDEFAQHLINSRNQERLTTSDAMKLCGDCHPVSQLGNLSFLVELQLSLDMFSLTIADLEKLHENSPCLRYMDFRDITFSASDEMPPGIVPRPRVVSIDWEFEEIRGPQILQYIEQKYPSLEDIRMKYDDYFNYDPKFTDGAAHIFEKGWLPLLASRGSQLLRVNGMGVKPGTDIFRVLDDYGCQLEFLDIYCEDGMINVNHFLQSRQCDSLLHLYIRDGDDNCIGSFRDTKLETLVLHFSEAIEDLEDYESETLFLDEFIKKCPDTLKELCLYNALVALGNDDGDDNDDNDNKINKDNKSEEGNEGNEDNEDDDFQSSITSISINTQPGYLGYCYFYEEEGYDLISKLCPNIEKMSISCI